MSTHNAHAHTAHPRTARARTPNKRADFRAYTARELRDARITRTTVDRKLASGEWHSPHRGIVCTVPASEACPIHMQLQVVTALIKSLPCDYVASHWTAATILGLPDRHLPLSTFALTRNGSRHRIVNRRGPNAAVRLFEAPLSADDVIVGDHPACTAPARTIFDTGRHLDFDSAVIQIEAAFSQNLVRRSELEAQIDAGRRVHGARLFKRALDFASELSDSPLESDFRLFLRRHGFTGFVQQVEIYDNDGWLIARVDFLFPELKLVLEVDGLDKYTNPAYGVSSPPDRFRREKERDRVLNDLGYMVIHASARDLKQPGQLLQALCNAGARRPHSASRMQIA